MASNDPQSSFDGQPDSQQSNPTVNTPFPAPPPFWTSFTTENLAAYQALEAKAAAGALPTPFELPPELKNLRPPTPPASGEYRSFGEGRSLAAPLTTLPPETTPLLPADLTAPTPKHLLNLTRSLLLSYLELLHVLATNPAAPVYGPKWDDLRDLFRNAHHALNMYRPWQAKDALIQLLEETRDKARSEIKGVDELKVKVESTLKNIENVCEDAVAAAEGRDMQDGDKMEGLEGPAVNGARETNGDKMNTQEEQERRLWAILNEEMEK